MITIVTDHPIAIDSPDHQWPAGTGWDNSVLPAFNAKLFKLWPHPYLLDIGCAGGGLVRSIINDGGFAVGVEGSDLSQRTKRAEWGVIPHHLFTADATKPFILWEDEAPLVFDIVTAWEFMEHIPADGIEGVLKNVKRHLTPDGIFVCSISTESSMIDGPGSGIEYHQTVRPKDWWMDRLAAEGFTEDEELRDFFAPDWVRGPNTGVAYSFCTVFRP